MIFLITTIIFTQINKLHSFFYIMNNQKKIKYLTWFMFFLLLLNVSIIVTFIFTIKKYTNTTVNKESEYITNNPIFPPPPHHYQFDFKEVLIKELILTKKQIEQIDIVRDNFRQKSHEYFSQIEKYSDSIDNELEKNTPDTALINLLATKIGLVHKDLKLHFVYYFFDLKQYLTEEQKQKYYKVFKEFKEKKKINKQQAHCKHQNH